MFRFGYILKKIVFNVIFFFITEEVIYSLEEEWSQIQAIGYIFWLFSGGNVDEELGNFFKKVFIPKQIFCCHLICAILMFHSEIVSYNDIIIYFGRLLISYE